MLVHGNALLALAAAVLWGGGDFSGGMSVKRAGGSMGAALRVILLSHSVSLIVLMALAWPVALVAALIWLAVAFCFRYSSLAALIAAVVSAAIAPFLADRATALLIAAIAFLHILRHQANIRRLIAGRESRISFRKS